MKTRDAYGNIRDYFLNNSDGWAEEKTIRNKNRLVGLVCDVHVCLGDGFVRVRFDNDWYGWED